MENDRMISLGDAKVYMLYNYKSLPTGSLTPAQVNAVIGSWRDLVAAINEKAIILDVVQGSGVDSYTTVHVMEEAQVRAEGDYGEIILCYRTGNSYVYSLLDASGGQSFYFGRDAASYLTSSHVQNNLTSTSATWPLAANQGRVLNEKINEVDRRITTIESNYVRRIVSSYSVKDSGNNIQLDLYPNGGVEGIIVLLKINTAGQWLINKTAYTPDNGLSGTSSETFTGPIETLIYNNHPPVKFKLNYDIIHYSEVPDEMKVFKVEVNYIQTYESGNYEGGCIMFLDEIVK